MADEYRPWFYNQPFGYDFKTWFCHDGGHVTQLGNMRCYSARCPAPCGALIIKRRPKHHGGRWPIYCPECSDAKRRAHDAGWTDRVRDVRSRRYAWRDAERVRVGLDPVRPGRPRIDDDPDALPGRAEVQVSRFQWFEK